jgi:cell division protein FtsZ
VLNRVMAQVAGSLHQILTRRGLIELHFADVRSLFGRFGGLEALENCWAGSAETAARAKAEELVDALLTQPLLREGGVLEGSDHALLSICGGEELSLQQVQKIVKALEARLPEGLAIATGACCDPAWEGRLTATLICANTTAREAVAPAKPKTAAPVRESRPAAPAASVVPEPQPTPTKAGRKAKAKQEELPLESLGRGRFERSSPVFHQGEDLDQPTFRRRGLRLRV